MFFAAAKALAGEVSDQDLERGQIFPPLERIREVSATIAARVAEVAYLEGLARKRKPKDLLAFIKSQMFEPRYKSYIIHSAASSPR
jgi:malate dehydrogenase (oxaloacetate-decarboxylating)(NADP+)